MSDEDVMNRVRELATGLSDLCACGWKRPKFMTFNLKNLPDQYPLPQKHQVEVFVNCPKCGAEHRLKFK